MKEIERAIAQLKNMLIVLTDDYAETATYTTCEYFLDDEKEDLLKQYTEEKEAVELALKVLQSELDRQENKALELSELKERIGKPVWVTDGKKGAWALIENVDLETNHIDYHIGTLINLDFEVCFYENPKVKSLKFEELKTGNEYYVLGKSKIIEFDNHSLSQDVIVKFEDGTYAYKSDLENGTFELYKHKPNGGE